MSTLTLSKVQLQFSLAPQSRQVLPADFSSRVAHEAEAFLSQAVEEALFYRVEGLVYGSIEQWAEKDEQEFQSILNHLKARSREFDKRYQDMLRRIPVIFLIT